MPNQSTNSPYENLDDEALTVLNEATRLAANTFHKLATEQEQKLIAIHMEKERRARGRYQDKGFH